MKRIVVAALLALAACQADRSAESGGSPQVASTADRVRDEAELLTSEEEARLTRQLATLEQRTRHQVGVATVRNLGGQSIEAFSLAYANRWALGRRGHDDGVVLLVAPADRKVRIEVGRGLESILTDEICASILRDHVTSRIAGGDYPGGIEAGVVAITERLEAPAP